MTSLFRFFRPDRRPVCAIIVILGSISLFPPAVQAESFQRISGEGSSWAAEAIENMRVNVKQFGITVDYNPSGSTTGRKNFINGNVDFAASDIPFQFAPEDKVSAPEKPEPGGYAYMPVTAGGTSFMYNLKINGERVTNLRLSGENVTKIFTAVITSWDDPAILADNPGLQLPKRAIVPVVRSDGSGSSAQFTRWLISQHNGLWQAYCKRTGREGACGQTSFYPTQNVPSMKLQAGDLGVAGYVAQSFAEGAIGYVNYSYAIGSRFPVAKVLNKAGYYSEPTPDNVAVSLLKAEINQDELSPDYLTQQLDGVYNDADQRNYPLSSYSYLILPTKLPEKGKGQFNEAKGKTMGAFAYYAMCQAQEQSASLGYSPMPINLVKSSFDQIKKIPGVVVQEIDVTKCKNPTFSPDGTNLLANNAKNPEECDRQGPAQCSTGTGGAKNVSTAVTKAGTPGATPGGALGPAVLGATGPSSAATGSTTTQANAAQATTKESVTDSDTPVCDPETGTCGEAADQSDVGVEAGPTARRAEQALPAAALAASSGWSVTQTLMLLVVVFTLGLLFVPGVAWRILSRRDSK